MRLKNMKNKITKTFVYKGFGFPITLINVPMRRVFGKWAMDINFNKLQLAVLYQLLHKPTLLNGDEIRFIRKFLSMTTTEFGNIFGVSHASVINWEKGTSHMPPASDIYLRLYLLNHQQAKDKEFRNMYTAISLESLAKSKGEEVAPISINIDEDLKTA